MQQAACDSAIQILVEFFLSIKFNVDSYFQKQANKLLCFDLGNINSTKQLFRIENTRLLKRFVDWTESEPLLVHTVATCPVRPKREAIISFEALQVFCSYYI